MTTFCDVDGEFRACQIGVTASDASHDAALRVAEELQAALGAGEVDAGTCATDVKRDAFSISWRWSNAEGHSDTFALLSHACRDDGAWYTEVAYWDEQGTEELRRQAAINKVNKKSADAGGEARFDDLTSAKKGCSAGVLKACRAAIALLSQTTLSLGGNGNDVRRKTAPYVKKACALGDAAYCDFVPLERGYFCSASHPPNTPTVDLPEEGFCSRMLGRCKGVREDWAALGWTVGECVKRQRVACYSYHLTLDDHRIEHCFSTFDECELWRGADAQVDRASRDISGVTKCAMKK